MLVQECAASHLGLYGEAVWALWGRLGKQAISWIAGVQLCALYIAIWLGWSLLDAAAAVLTASQRDKSKDAQDLMDT